LRASARIRTFGPGISCVSRVTDQDAWSRGSGLNLRCTDAPKASAGSSSGRGRPTEGERTFLIVVALGARRWALGHGLGDGRARLCDRPLGSLRNVRLPDRRSVDARLSTRQLDGRALHGRRDGALRTSSASHRADPSGFGIMTREPSTFPRRPDQRAASCQGSRSVATVESCYYPE